MIVSVVFHYQIIPSRPLGKIIEELLFKGIILAFFLANYFENLTAKSLCSASKAKLLLVGLPDKALFHIFGNITPRLNDLGDLGETL